MLTTNFILLYLGCGGLGASLFIFGAQQTPKKLHPVMRRGMAITGLVVMAIMFFVTTIKLSPMLLF